MQKAIRTATTVTSENPYRRAKVEHYLQRAEEYLRMARYWTAKKTLDTVFALDPGNRAALSLQKRIQILMETVLQAPQASSTSGTGTNGSSRKHTRSEIILIVDQDERILVSLVENIRTYGFRVVGAAGFDEAVETVGLVQPQLIISEVNFETGPAGFDLYVHIRNNPQMHEIPFLYLATRVNREMLIAGKRLGVDDFILKPLDEEVVIASILNSLKKRKK